MATDKRECFEVVGKGRGYSAPRSIAKVQSPQSHVVLLQAKVGEVWSSSY